MNIWSVFLIYLFYSCLGWLLEVSESFIREKRFVNRGFLIGPYCPIYGVSLILIIFTLKDYIEKPFGMFIISMVICGFVEYMGSYLLEKLFKTRWWDYTHKRFNINGRICLDNLIFFGLGCMLVMYVINPFIVNVVSKIPKIPLIIISSVLFIGYIIDTIVSFKIIWNFKNISQDVHKDSTEKVTEYVRKVIIKNNKLLYKRLLKAFPKLEVIKNFKKKKK